ncbi:MAG: phosphoribosylpyrophosphate synthetase [Clostridiales bacterium]|nr:phosphoribosylpyrophosphate synthetase [Clostridiales bacterium]
MLNKKNIRELQKVPFGQLGIIATRGSHELCKIIDQYLVEWRNEYISHTDKALAFPGYHRESFLISADCLRFSSGEGKGVINETVRGYDLFIVADIGNYNCKFKMFGMDCPMSPDDHFQDIKRIISAVGGKARRITLIMPMLYQGRQHKRISRESMDCAIALQELEHLGIDNIITFDAHDPRVQNSIPLIGFENVQPTYQIIKALLRTEKDLCIDPSRMMVISPDEGGMSRNLYYASMLGLDLGLFYKRRDYTRVVNGRNPIVRHEFLGDSVEGKDVLIVDDMVSSGESLMDIAIELKRRNARRIYMAVTFALFTDGLEKFNEAHSQGLFEKLFATNLTYRKEELIKAPWFVEVDMSKFIAHLINTINHDESIGSLLDPSDKIKKLLADYNC